MSVLFPLRPKCQKSLRLNTEDKAPAVSRGLDTSWANRLSRGSLSRHSSPLPIFPSFSLHLFSSPPLPVTKTSYSLAIEAVAIKKKIRLFEFSSGSTGNGAAASGKTHSPHVSCSVFPFAFLLHFSYHFGFAP